MHVQIDMVDEDVLRTFARRLGLGRVSRGSLTTTGKQKWRWAASSFEQGQAALAMMWPWLGERRRAQMKRVLQEEAARVETLKQPFHRSLVVVWFGRHLSDLTPSEHTEYRRRISARQNARLRTSSLHSSPPPA